MNRLPMTAPPARIALAIAAAMAAHAMPAKAGDLSGPGQTATVTASSPVESWTVSDGAQLNVLGGTTGQVTARSATIIMDGGTTITAGRRDALSLANGSTANISDSSLTSASRFGISFADVGGAGSGRVSTANVVNSVVQGDGAAVNVSNGGQLTVSGERSRLTGTGSGIVSGFAEGAAGVSLIDGSVRLLDGATARGAGNGIAVYLDARTVGTQGRSIVVSDATVEGTAGAAIAVRSGAVPTDVGILVANGAQLIGGNGVALDVGDNSSASMRVGTATIVGDVVASGKGIVNVTLDADGILVGRMSSANDVAVGSQATWTVTGDSDVGSLALNGGTVAFDERGPAAPASVRVRGDLGGSGGTIGLRTAMDAVGPLSAQSTDRLLVEGNVTTTGPTLIEVIPSGDAIETDANGNGVVDANEGISLVQVGGDSRADAFALKGGYVAIGGYQYRLHAFGPGQADPAQNALSNGSLNWDYRLGNAGCTEAGCGPVTPPPPCENEPCEPVDPPVDPPVVVPPERDAVVPQLPSYLSAPAALLTYGDMLNDGLRQRLGDIRNGESGAPLGGEVFARFLGGQLRYESNRSFRDYGYDFDQQVNALQIGGGLVSLDGDNGTLRVGWALDRGTTRVSPQAVDGDSSTKYRATGGTAWVTWQAGNGWWVDAVVSGQRYRGDVATDMRGSNVARIRATGTTMSAEVGKPFDVGGGWVIEPRAQVKYQTLRFADFADADGLTVNLGTARQTGARIGALVSRIANPRLMPYARLDLTHTSNGDPSADVSSEAWNVSDRFGSGRVGNAVRVAAGATSQLTPHVQLYGEGTYQRFVGSYGLRGWAGNLGVRVTF
ncbi:autotransporter outer membrane beta-barrel domain-containing protein [Luteibacter aegosomatis]|uniref:autotransporter family protein n=1 Tax=Luteibacter aegosomatis TaxID=2911537 RepID=UPI001FFB5012|nr:autotransporter outer membrane beta-barrel domain-containing protein [Luteibacter aegosomatis]UPG87737.1 autotransporter outer membrane beta-barrel domain-containing protein [Luteibacter aegosomatis]